MHTRDLLTDAFTRIHELHGDVVDDLDAETAHRRPDGAGNSIAWLLWHASRIEDDHIAGLAGTDQAWEEWRERFGLPLEEHDHGYGHSSGQVDAVRIEDLSLLTRYHEAVHQRTLAYLQGVDSEELDRVVDTRWDPPVTAGVRLVSVVSDSLQHLGQAAYVKGLPGGS